MKEPLKQISDLVERFERNIDAYHRPAYNETQLRRDFIDPFFEALGWDVTNKAGYAEQYKGVIHEDAIKIGGATKTPDDKIRLQRLLDATDHQIDSLVYELYGLTEKEIQIIEGGI